LRRGDNLIYTHSLTLKEALTSAPICIHTLDNRDINVNLDQVITPQTVHKIPSEGMP
jgi:DnaJ family protein B protein 4